MPKPKSGTAGSPVTPADPTKASEADKANPGEVEKIKAAQRQSKTGKYGAVQAPAHDPAKGKQAGKKSWIEIELRDEDGKPVPGEPYRVILPDGQTVAEGTLNQKGFARIEGIDSGTCQVVFPKREKSCWKKA